MVDVIKYSRALGEAIVASDAFRTMQLAESEAQADPAACQMENAAAQLVEQLRMETDPGHRQALSGQLEALKQSMNELPSIRRREAAREDFSRLMEQVNNILQFTITGEISTLSSCSGNCGTCGGCH